MLGTLRRQIFHSHGGCEAGANQHASILIAAHKCDRLLSELQLQRYAVVRQVAIMVDRLLVKSVAPIALALVALTAAMMESISIPIYVVQS